LDTREIQEKEGFGYYLRLATWETFRLKEKQRKHLKKKLGTWSRVPPAKDGVKEEIRGNNNRNGTTSETHWRYQD